MDFPKSRPWERHSSQSTLFGGDPQSTRKGGRKENGSYLVKGVLLSRLPLGHLELNSPGNCGGQFEIHTLASSWSRDEGAGEFTPQVTGWGLLLGCWCPDLCSHPWDRQPEEALSQSQEMGVRNGAFWKGWHQQHPNKNPQNISPLSRSKDSRMHDLIVKVDEIIKYLFLTINFYLLFMPTTAYYMCWYINLEALLSSPSFRNSISC